MNNTRFDSGRYKKILVRSTNWLGDAVMSTPFITLLRRLAPEAFIEISALPYIAPVFENNPAINKISILTRDTGLKAAAEIFKSFLPGRSSKYDLGISLPNSIGAALDLKKSGCREILGYNRGGRGFLLNFSVKATEEILCTHEIYYYMNLLRAFAGNDSHPLISENFEKISGGLEAAYSLYLTREETGRAIAELNRLGISPEKDIILGINPGAFYGTAKRWPTERYAETARRLTDQFDRLKILVFGAAAEIEIGEKICGELNDRAINLCARTTIRQLMAFISQCNLFLTNDSGAMHIAAAFNVPVTAIFGPTDHKSTYPLTQNYKIIRREIECSPCKKRECPHGHHLCMKNIDAGTVIESISGDIERIE